MDKQPKVTYHFGRLIWLVPCVLAGDLFGDPAVGFWYGMAMAFVTSRIFPIMDVEPTAEERHEKD